MINVEIQCVCSDNTWLTALSAQSTPIFYTRQSPVLSAIINPRRACAARVTVVYMYVCMCVCVCVHSYTHWNHKREIPTDSAQYRDRFKLPKCFVQKLWRNMPTSSSSGVLALFSARNKLLCWFEAYSYVFTAQTTGLWKTACDSLAQTRETAQIYGSRILIAPPASAYTQYK